MIYRRIQYLENEAGCGHIKKLVQDLCILLNWGSKLQELLQHQSSEYKVWEVDIETFPELKQSTIVLIRPRRWILIPYHSIV